MERRQIVAYGAMILFCASSLFAQRLSFDINVELTAASFAPGRTVERGINRNFREDDPFNAVRGKLFPHIRFDEMFGVEAELLFDNKAVNFDHTRNQRVRLDGLFGFIHGLYGNRLNLWLGRIPTPVGTFSQRSYSHSNPLIGYPLAYHFKVPYNAFQLSSEESNLMLRDNGFGAATSIYEACWITGVSVFGTIEGLDYLIAAGRGTLTNPEAAANRGFQIAGRLGLRFSEVVRVGISAGLAPYLQKDQGLPAGMSIRDPKHLLLGFDVQYIMHELTLSGEAFYNSWDTPQYRTERSIQAFFWYLEGQYHIIPRLYAAARFDQTLFSKITDPFQGGKTPWGYDITRIEAGIGFDAASFLKLKGVVQYNKLEYPISRNVTIIALQSAFHFQDISTLAGL